MPDGLRKAIAARLRAAGCVFAEDEADVLLATSNDPDVLAAMSARRACGIPLEQVVGWADFCGVRVTITEGIFVPRPRSALLVDRAATLASRAALVDRTTTGAPIVVDLCCGSGAIGAAVAARVPEICLHAADLDPAAVRCARANLAAAAGDATAHQGDLFAALPADLRGRVSVLVANVPYVPTGELRLLPREARLHEPRAAFDGGLDGLAVLRRVAAAAPSWLVPGGAVLMETSRAQARRAAHDVARHGFRTVVASDAGLGATVVIGRRPVAAPRLLPTARPGQRPGCEIKAGGVSPPR